MLNRRFFKGFKNVLLTIMSSFFPFKNKTFSTLSTHTISSFSDNTCLECLKGWIQIFIDNVHITNPFITFAAQPFCTVSPQLHLSFALQKTESSGSQSIEKRNLQSHPCFASGRWEGVSLRRNYPFISLRENIFGRNEECVMDMSRSTDHQGLQFTLCNN